MKKKRRPNGSVRTKFMDYIGKHPGKMTHEIANAIGEKQSSIGGNISTLVSLCQLKQIGGGFYLDFSDYNRDKWWYKKYCPRTEE